MYSLTSTFKAPITILSRFNMYVIYSNTHILLKEVEKEAQNENMYRLLSFSRSCTNWTTKLWSVLTASEFPYCNDDDDIDHDDDC